MLRAVSRCVVVLCALALGASAATAPAPKAPKAPPEKQAKPKPKRKRRPNPAFAKIQEDPALPRVLLIGDSISIGYTVPVRKLLAGKANVLRIPGNGGPTTRGLQSIDKWLAVGKLDVIHFNWGLHDCRIEWPADRLQIPIADYEKNLKQLVARLKKTGAKLVWASTTAVVDGEKRKRRQSDVQAYNKVAAAIMEAEGVAINDLYAALMRIDESVAVDPDTAGKQRPKAKIMTRQMASTPDGTHFTGQGYQVLAHHVVKAITAALDAK
ncbi:MAG: SGNH/GDSL hydrolase family protein [Candidatus Brocadiae bacterium]|nr:SGNH/GDSL hydrolase family protein [Candidatus Brocadiia bacterium]